MAYDYGQLFTNNFNAGIKQGQQVAEDQQAAQVAADIYALRQKYQQQAAAANAYDAYNQQLADQDKATFGDTGLTPQDYQYGSAPQATPMSQQYLQIADIYAKNGMADKAGQYMDLGYQTGRQEQHDATQAVEQGLRLKGLQRADTQAEQTDAFNTGMTKLLASGKRPTLEDINTLAGQTGVDPEQAHKAYLDAIGLQEQHRVQLLNDYYDKVAGAPDFKTMVDNAVPHPDGSTPQVVKNKDGSRSIIYGGQVIMPHVSANDEEARGQVLTHLQSMMTRNPNLATSVALDQMSKQAEIGLKRAQSNEAYHRSSYYDRLPQDSSRAYLQTLTPEERDKLKRLSDMYEAESDPQKRQTIAQNFVIAKDAIDMRHGGNVPSALLTTPKGSQISDQTWLTMRSDNEAKARSTLGKSATPQQVQELTDKLMQQDVAAYNRDKTGYAAPAMSPLDQAIALKRQQAAAAPTQDLHALAQQALSPRSAASVPPPAPVQAPVAPQVQSTTGGLIVPNAAPAGWRPLTPEELAQLQAYRAHSARQAEPPRGLTPADAAYLLQR